MQRVAHVERNQVPRLCRQQGDRLQVDRRPPAVLIDRCFKCAMAAAVAPKLCMAAERRPDFLGHLYDCAPELLKAGDLARRFAALILGDDDAGLEQWSKS